ncbi:hypothetical protein NE599_21170 [[Clostridium] symbiosum]|nr:hypothetical protein [[Clostridium] symbiosum]MCQ4991484.1 hypothetical protein [[Clostridium] symbiosum]
MEQYIMKGGNPAILVKEVRARVIRLVSSSISSLFIMVCVLLC